MDADRGSFAAWSDLGYRPVTDLYCSYSTWFGPVDVDGETVDIGFSAAACDLDGDGRLSWTYRVNDPDGFWYPTWRHGQVLQVGDDA